ncbi:MAG: family protein phosphatase [Solirubrobacterales bacterium]|jgi:protein phosphatase|nr:family protein phosphatase [Solirubrobacterales bacterium]
MLKVVDEAKGTDTGRQRRANEDSFFARAPLFAVADGMGGAQAGEVASKIAAEAFEPALREGQAPERQLARIVKNANKRIHELAKDDASRAGMGTTLTAALIGDGEVSFAHVGDSRAYRLRDGELKQLTNDHSLVEELRRQGRLTDEQAVDHPQRSIITRALGPEPDVDVDTMTFPAKEGDVYLLCSDGLTTMVLEERIAQILRGATSLDTAVRKLIQEANQNGGRDNITAVAFRLGDAELEPEPDEDLTLIGPAAEREGLTAEAIRAAAAEPDRPRRPLRATLKLALVALILAGVVAAALWGARQVYFLGGDGAGRLALYRGLPYDLPFGIHLYDERYATAVQVDSLTPQSRRSATDHKLRSHSDAVDLVRFIERQRGLD